MAAGNETAVAVQETERPFPPRFWWLKRIGIVVCAIPLILLGVRQWEVYRAQNALQAELDAARALREPLDVADLTAHRIGSKNAADVRRRAALLVKDIYDVALGPSPANSPAPPVQLPDEDSPEGRKLVEKWVRANSPALSAARQLRQTGEPDWGPFAGGPPIIAYVSDLHGQTSLASILERAAIVAHRGGDDAAAVEYLREELAVGRGLRTMPMGASFAATVAISSGVASAIGQMPDLLTGDRPELGGPRPASNDQIRALIRDLADDSYITGRLAQLEMEERAVQLDTVRTFDSKLMAVGTTSMGSRVVVWAFKPMTLRQDVRRMRYFDQAISAAQAGDTYPVVAARFPQRLGVPPRAPEPAGFRLGLFYDPRFDPAALHFSEIALRRLASVALADKLYRLEQGRPAGRIEDLIPYLPAPPRDPFGPPGALLQMDTKAPRRVYSVGPNIYGTSLSCALDPPPAQPQASQ